MAEFDIRNESLAEGGRRRIEWAEREMPVLSRSSTRSDRFPDAPPPRSMKTGSMKSER